MSSRFQTRRRLAALGLAGAAGTLLATPAVHAQSYPSRPVRILVPFSAGGAFDAVGRLLAPGLAEQLGQPVVVENRPGAGGTIAAQAVARGAADGYTLLLGDIGTHNIAPFLYSKLAYDPQKDFVAINHSVTLPLVVVVNPAVPANDIRGYLAHVRANASTSNYASSGSGGISHLAVEQLKAIGQVDIQHIPYKGAAQALADVVSGQVQMMAPSVATALPFIQAGKLRPIGVTSERRLTLLPDVPPIAESLPGYVVEPWVGLLVAAGTPGEAVERLRQASHTVLASTALRERLVAAGFEVVNGSGDALAGVIRKDAERWGRIVAQSGAKID